MELRLVDLHGTVVKPRLTAEERARNLAILRTYLPIKVSAEIEQLGIRLRRQRLHLRSRRCLRHNRDFGPVHTGGLEWQVRYSLQNEQARRILDAPDEFLAKPAKLLKAGRSATVGAGDGFVLKRFNLRRVSRLFKDLFRASPAAASFRKAYHLELTGIPTARAVAMAERRVVRFLVRSYFLMEEIPGAKSLQDVLKAGPPDRKLIESVAELIGRLHREGFSHRDLKPSNIVFDATNRPHLIDLDGLVWLDDVSESRATADLNRLARGVAQFIEVSCQQRLQFIGTYRHARSA